MTIAEYIEVLKTLPQDAVVKSAGEPVAGFMHDPVCVNEEDVLLAFHETTFPPNKWYLIL